MIKHCGVNNGLTSSGFLHFLSVEVLEQDARAREAAVHTDSSTSFHKWCWEKRQGRCELPAPLGEMMPLSATLSHPNEGRRTFKELACNYRFPVLQQRVQEINLAEESTFTSSDEPGQPSVCNPAPFSSSLPPCYDFPPPRQTPFQMFLIKNVHCKAFAYFSILYFAGSLI